MRWCVWECMCRLQMRSHGREVDAGQYDVERERDGSSDEQRQLSHPLGLGRAASRPRAGWLAGLPSLLLAFRHASANAHLNMHRISLAGDASLKRLHIQIPALPPFSAHTRLPSQPGRREALLCDGWLAASWPPLLRITYIRHPTGEGCPASSVIGQITVSVCFNNRTAPVGEFGHSHPCATLRALACPGMPLARTQSYISPRCMSDLETHAPGPSLQCES